MSLIKRLSLLSLILVTSIGWASSNNITEFTLDNGLKVIVKEDHRAPVVLSEIWYKVGSSYEPDGITGISHALEHMMFQGTAKYPETSFFNTIAENGGEQNAFTTADYTAYYQQLAKEKLALSFELEADRMQNLSLKSENFDKEIKVVQEERRLRTDNNPIAQAYERFQAAAYIANPYHHPVVGWASDLQHMNIQNVRDWYHSWYGPNNATLVVVGDVKPAEVKALAEKYFGHIKPIKTPEVKPVAALAPLGTREVNVNVPANLPYLMMGYNVDSLATSKDKWESYALEVLSGILSGSDSARLPKQLVRQQQIATQADTDYGLYSRLPTLFGFYGIPAQGHDMADLKQAFLQQIKTLQEQPVTKAELDRVKAMTIANKIYAQDSATYQAFLIGSLESVGLSWRDIDNYAKQINAVTPEQVQAVAKKYLVPERLTIAKLKPLPLQQQSQGEHHAQ